MEMLFFLVAFCGLWGLWGGLGKPLGALGFHGPLLAARLGGLVCPLGSLVSPPRFRCDMDATFRVNVAHPPRLRTESSLPELSSGSTGSTGSSGSSGSAGNAFILGRSYPGFYMRRGPG